MDLANLFLVVALAAFGAVAAASMAHSAWLDRHRYTQPATLEATWRKLTAPLFLGMLGVAFVVGWAIQEPDPADEWVSYELIALAALVAAVLLRACVRAARSALAAHRSTIPIGTVGLLRCRTVVSPEFANAASSEVLTAALAHEAAHARGRDPIRLLLAQFAADLQFPLPQARQQYRDFVHLLEVRRDDEAVARGACPVALAEGILLAAKLTHRTADPTCVRITGGGDRLAQRVRRLLDPTAPGQRPAPSRNTGCWFLAQLIVAAALGGLQGEAVLRLIPGVMP